MTQFGPPRNEALSPSILVSSGRIDLSYRCYGKAKADYFSRRGWMADPDGSPYSPHAEATLIQTDCPAATAGSPTPTGSCRICAAGASAASAGERPPRPAARFLWSHATAGSFSQQGRAALLGSSARCQSLEKAWARRGGRGVLRDSVRGAPPAQQLDTI